MRRELAGEVGVLIFLKDDLEPIKRVDNEIFILMEIRNSLQDPVVSVYQWVWKCNGQTLLP